ncbi:MAG: STAS domain-containing protein [Parachlamydiaceae bacterium]
MNNWIFMQLQYKVQDNYLIVKILEKRFDVISCFNLKEETLAITEKTKINDLILDLQNIEFIDSAGLVCFLSLWKDLRKKKGSLKFANLTSPVKRVIELVLLNKVFDIYENIESALLEH